MYLDMVINNNPGRSIILSSNHLVHANSVNLRISTSSQISAPTLFCGQVLGQQRMYSFRHVVLVLDIILGHDLGKIKQVPPLPPTFK